MTLDPQLVELRRSLARFRRRLWLRRIVRDGSLILAGRFLVTRPSWASKLLVAVGCFAGMVATMWTLLLPVLAGTLLVLTAFEQPDRVTPPEAGPADRIAQP